MKRKKKTFNVQGFEVCQWDISYGVAKLIRGLKRENQRAKRGKEKQK